MKNVTFLVANVTFLSGRDYIFDCRTVFDHMTKSKNTLLQ